MLVLVATSFLISCNQKAKDIAVEQKELSIEQQHYLVMGELRGMWKIKME